MNGKEYVVTFTRNRRMARNYYTDSRKDAEEIYNQLCKDGWRVEILFGTPGHYETVKKNY